MARPLKVRKDLSAGWKRLHYLWKLPLKEKLRYSIDLIEANLQKFTNPLICWSGGKDSTVVLHIIRKFYQEIPVIYIDTGVDFSEAVSFVYYLSEKWSLNLYTAKPIKGESFWDIGQKYGWPIFGKNIASNVERANRSGNIRPQMSKLESLLAKNKLHISAKCTHYIQERPSKIIEKELNADLKIIGLRASESRARVRLWVDHSDCYKVKHYYGKNKEICKLNPIATWTAEDIWEYHKMNKIPYCKLYDIGYSRNGCWPCAMGIRNGQLERLRLGHPQLFNRLIYETEMGKEISKAEKVLCKTLIQNREK